MTAFGGWYDNDRREVIAFGQEDRWRYTWGYGYWIGALSATVLGVPVLMWLMGAE